MVKLIIKNKDESRWEERTFDQDVVTMGRAGQNDLVLKDPKASRLHCRLKRRKSGYVLFDAGSHNGTRVNGLQVMKHTLRTGDVITVGDTDIGVEEPPENARKITLESHIKEHNDALLRQLTRERSNLLRLQEVNHAINSEINLHPLLERIMDVVIELTSAERGFLIIVKDHEMEFEIARNFKKAEVDQPELAISRSIAKQVIQGRRPMIVVNARDDDRFREVQSITNLGLRSVLCVPLILKGEVIGAVYVDNRLDKAVFSEEDLPSLEAFADQTAIAIHNAQQMEELREKNSALERNRSEMERMNKRLARTVRTQESELKKAKARLVTSGQRTGIGYHYGGIVGYSRAMKEIFNVLERVIDSEYPVLIHGESGTGKELIATAVHYNSRRAEQPFVSENCAALPDTLLESELFGHMRGAFTGAVSNRKGLLEQADEGTLFLDEVGEMSVEMQKKLLRFLQEGEFRPVGGTNPIRVNVRIISASNRDLLDLVKENRFRMDLFYRLNVLPIHLPPLRERKEDIPQLIEHFLAILCEEVGCEKKRIDSQVVDLLCRYPWPGNVRELENEMRRLVTLSDDVITYELVSDMIKTGPMPDLGFGDLHDMDLNERIETIEKHEILKALGETGGNKSKAARKLGISRFTLQRKIDKYKLQPGS
ncbi:MAG: sigma 54-interacting transcriptional regulator [Planctomycetota bacterium]